MRFEQQHNQPIVGVSLNRAVNALVTGSVDGDTRVYDVRSPTTCVRTEAGHHP